ncbi:hypothetical protein QBC43DRAFT_269968 [Cladorrhinum sp. PSN259]|nr:hypothetical protein QBC43DRAFT_269968 [Cladorrhinum sp. PSN259]
MGSNSNSNRNRNLAPEDPSTTTTTEWDSGESDGVEYVYKPKQSEKQAATTKSKSKSPRRKRSPKDKNRSPHRCSCGLRKVDDDDDGEDTAYEEDALESGEEEGSYHSHSTATKHRSSTSTRCTGKCQGKEQKEDKKKTAGKKHNRKKTPYIEEYPDEPLRPKVLLKEHKVPRRQSTSDAKRGMDPEQRPSSALPRGRSPAGKRASASSHTRIKTSPKRSAHRKHQIEVSPGRHQESPSDPDSPRLEPNESPGPSSPRRTQTGVGIGPTPIIARSTAWTEDSQEYSSPRPMNSGALHMAQAQSPQQDLQYDSDDEKNHCPSNDEAPSSDQGHTSNSSEIFDDQDRLPRERKLQRELEQARERELQRERDLKRERDRQLERELKRQQELKHERELQRQRERERELEREQELQRERDLQRQQELQRERELLERARQSPPRRGHTMPASTYADPYDMDHGATAAPSVFTTGTEVWRGRAEDWESPYPSDNEHEYSDDDRHRPCAELYGPNGQLLLPAAGGMRSGTPSLMPVPPQGARSQFGFAPSGVTRRSSQGSRGPGEGRRLGGRGYTAPAKTRTWPGVVNGSGRRVHGVFLMDEDGGREMVEEPQEDMGNSRWPLVRVPTARPPTGSALFSARGSKEFLSPQPVRVDRFDCDVWGRSRTEVGVVY